MRDPTRIDRIIDRLRDVWHEYPDLRLCQLVSNTVGYGGRDPYYVEDDEFEKFLINWEPQRMSDGFVVCPLCHEPERVEDMLAGVCLSCADGIAFSQHNRRASIVVKVKE